MTAMTDPSILPKNPAHQRLVDLVLSGLKPSKAYAMLYPKSKANTRHSNSSRILKRPDCKAYKEHILTQAADDQVLSVREKRHFLARVVRAKVNTLPDDSDLWQEIRISETENASNRFYKLPGKLESIKLDNELDNIATPEADAMNNLAKALASLGNASVEAPSK